MRSLLKYDGRAVRVAIVVLGLVALTAPSFVLSPTDAYAIECAGSGGATPPGGGEQSEPGNANTTAIIESFQSLSQAQQTRVMQRCKDVLAAPSRASSNQIGLCQTLNALAKR